MNKSRLRFDDWPNSETQLAFELIADNAQRRAYWQRRIRKLRKQVFRNSGARHVLPVQERLVLELACQLQRRELSRYLARGFCAEFIDRALLRIEWNTVAAEMLKRHAEFNHNRPRRKRHENNKTSSNPR